MKQVQTCDEFWRGLLADESTLHEEQKRRIVRFTVFGWTETSEGDVVTLTGGGIWDHSRQSSPILLACGGRRILSEKLRSQYFEDGEFLLELSFDLKRKAIQVYVNRASHGFHSFDYLSRRVPASQLC